jgi:hypothetical protein
MKAGEGSRLLYWLMIGIDAGGDGDFDGEVCCATISLQAKRSLFGLRR